MIKKLLCLCLCVVISLLIIGCDNTSNNSNITNTLEENQGTKTYNTLFDKYPSVFVTENISHITFYSYYGQGTGSKVPDEYMTEIINWLASFTIEKKAADEDVPPGTNTYYVEIEYSDGTIIKEGLDRVKIDGTIYILNKAPYPDCFMDIISSTSLK